MCVHLTNVSWSEGERIYEPIPRVLNGRVSKREHLQMIFVEAIHYPDNTPADNTEQRIVWPWARKMVSVVVVFPYDSDWHLPENCSSRLGQLHNGRLGGDNIVYWSSLLLRGLTFYQ